MATGFYRRVHGSLLTSRVRGLYTAHSGSERVDYRTFRCAILQPSIGDSRQVREVEEVGDGGVKPVDRCRVPGRLCLDSSSGIAVDLICRVFNVTCLAVESRHSLSQDLPTLMAIIRRVVTDISSTVQGVARAPAGSQYPAEACREVWG